MNTFGDALRKLMDDKEVTGLQLAADIGITPTSVSRILTGKSRPRQVTFTRIMKCLCESRAEEQELIRAYSGLEALPEETAHADTRNAEEDEARVKRFLDVKTQSILFKRSVGRELAKAGIEFTADYCKGAISTDFLIEANGQRIALECRFNVHRDLERAVITAKVLREALGCNTVITVTPFDISDTAPKESGFVTATPSEAIERLQKSMPQKAKDL